MSCMCVRTYVSLIVCLLCQMDGFKETAKKREKKRSIWCFFLNLTSLLSLFVYFPEVISHSSLFIRYLLNLSCRFSVRREEEERKKKKLLVLYTSAFSFFFFLL